MKILSPDNITIKEKVFSSVTWLLVQKNATNCNISILLLFSHLIGLADVGKNFSINVLIYESNKLFFNVFISRLCILLFIQSKIYQAERDNS